MFPPTSTMKRRHITMKIKAMLLLPLSTFLVFGLGQWGAHGLKVENSRTAPRFNSLMDLQNYNLQTSEKNKTRQNLSKWNKWKNSQSLGDRLNEEFLQHDGYPSNFINSPGLNKVHSLNRVTPSLFIRKYVRQLPNIHGRGRKSSVQNQKIISRVKPSPSVQFWSKRDTNPKPIPHSSSSDGTATVTNVANLALVDSELEKLTPDPRCKEKMGLCAKMPAKSLECLLHCHLSANVLVQSSTKFLFRLQKVFGTYPKILCPTFGQIYNDIPSIIKQGKWGNSLRGFLAGVGIADEAPVDVEFIKNSPSALFNNLVKFGQGEDLELVKSIVDTAETAAKVQLSEKNLFPSVYGNTLCKLAPKEGWFVSMIDAVTKHPTLSDIFLRGYWIMTRALSLDLQSPLDGLFVSFVYSIKLLTGVDCSIVAYAEQGKPFKCKQPPPIDNILEEYATSAKEQEEENMLSWVVCGAHQVEIPDWIQTKEGLNGRSGAIDFMESNNTTLEKEKSIDGLNDDLEKFPIPDEGNSYEDNEKPTL